MIKSLPYLIKKYPDLLYIIAGETHPVVREEEGEKYRNQLKKLVKELELQKHVKFYNKYMALQEVIDYILASDVYVCTNLDKNQMSSGTLAYAMGCGRTVVSTAISYAEEILQNQRGLIVDFKNPKRSEERRVGKEWRSRGSPYH